MFRPSRATLDESPFGRDTSYRSNPPGAGRWTLDAGRWTLCWTLDRNVQVPFASRIAHAEGVGCPKAGETVSVSRRVSRSQSMSQQSRCGEEPNIRR